MIIRSILAVPFVLSISLLVRGQGDVQVNAFGHLEYEFYHKPDSKKNESFFRLGEHDLFINAKISKKITFLSETVIRSDSKTASGFGVSIERAFLKYNYKGEHNLIVGKVHTPLNYWNDVYHHGRLFFPTIDRPFNFDYFMPIHVLGIRAQGQNLGNLNLGYDFQVGNSMESTDFGANGILLSYLASVHIKPVEGLRLMAGYYYDLLPNNHHGPHAHAGTNHNDDYHDALETNQINASVAYFGDKFEFLNEAAFVINKTDSLGTANNISNYTYLGYRIKEKYIPFVNFDYLHIAPNELHVNPKSGMKITVGMRWEFDPKCNLKIQLEKYGKVPAVKDVPGIENKYEIKLQLAYAI